MAKKYELTDDTIRLGSHTLHRIKALVPIKRYGIKVGDLGGFIEKEDNLSHDDDAWVANDAKVCEGARIEGNALVCNNAVVSGNAIVCGHAEVRGNASIHDNVKISARASVGENAMIRNNVTISGKAIVRGKAELRGNVKVSSYAIIKGNVCVRGDAWISKNAEVDGNAVICDDAKIFEVDDFVLLDNIGLFLSATTFFRTKDSKVIKVYNAGFFGTLDEYESRSKTAIDKKRSVEGLMVVDLIKNHFK